MISNRINFEAIIETAAGLVNVNEIAASSSRLQSAFIGCSRFCSIDGNANNWNWWNAN